MVASVVAATGQARRRAAGWFTGGVIRTLTEVAAATVRDLTTLPDHLRDELRATLVITPADPLATASRLRDRVPVLPNSFLGVVESWHVLGRSFTGFIDFMEAEKLDGDRVTEAFELDRAEFVAFASNGSGDPIGVAPTSAEDSPPGSILHFNHDARSRAILAPDLTSFLIGLGNYGECWDPTGEAPAETAGQRLQESLEALGWPSEIRRFWPDLNENGAFN